MLFNSAQYAFFLVVVFFGFWALARFNLARTLLLLAASYYFYAQWNPYYLVLIFLSSTVDFFVGSLLGRNECSKWRGWLLSVSVVFNLGVLCTFKYFNFFADTFIRTAVLFGLELEPFHLGVLLPVGISFYTFQSMSYTVDIYRKKLEPERSYLRYLLFVSLFPQLVAGPIVRASNLLPQLEARPRLSPEQGSRAIALILIGLVKKVAIADVLAVNLVDRVFDFPERFSVFEVTAAIYGYAIQIYCDFSGYSDIAIGSALLLGLHIPINFNAPYQAVDLRDFWRRWHISLSTWLRDYLYIPLGGSKRGSGATYLNLMFTMLLGGLWHGAAWTFVLWGALHGLALAATRALQRAKLFESTRLTRTIGLVATFHFVCFCWVIFRSQSLEQAFSVIGQLGSGDWGLRNLPLHIVAVLCIGFVTHWLPSEFIRRINSAFASLPPVAQAFVAAFVVTMLCHVASTEAVPFIYFQF